MMNTTKCYDEDKSTLSNGRCTQARHLDWTASIDFENHIIDAIATYRIEILDQSCRSIELDTRGLDISEIQVDGEITDAWKVDKEIKGKAHLGQRLSIQLKAEQEAKEVNVVIKYKTSADPEKCTAVQWLTPAQTSGKKYPYLFTQCQAIHARSIIPCYDCPAVKMTYSAEISVPQWATAIMSALPKSETNVGESIKKWAEGVISAVNPNETTHTFRFHQPVPISAYLFALCCGELASKDISPRCRIWSEPCILSAAAAEFHQTELFLKTAEDITSVPYAWQRYDLLVLPGSFPYGGMENPCLTFVTPTLLAGDGSLVCVVAHEIAHSWTGNLVTNKTWGHFWLNEGWTTWLQRRIMNRIENIPSIMDLDAIGGAFHLQQDVDMLDKSMTSLYLSLGDDDPDESYSSVPYEKGFHLLYALERLVGEDVFLELVQAYIKKFANGTITSEEFKEFCVSFWEPTNQDAYTKMKAFDWNTWIYETGMPPSMPEFDKTLAEAAESLASAWVAFDSGKESDQPSTSIDKWSSAQKVCFLDALLKLVENDGNESPMRLKISTLKLFDKEYGFEQSSNAEILFRYCMLSVHSEDKDIYPIVVRFVSSQGRMKYIRPLYRAMFASSSSREIAVDTFVKNKDFYHPIASKMIAYDMTKGGSEGFMGKIKDGLMNLGIQSNISSTVTIGVAAAAIGAVTLMRSRK